ncbi:hypothetical protein ACO0K3_03655 [Undibacterium sp. Rencai35W]|uniref:hypothetical protein n=1 Tax=Undibacterium sp. Rencai35W TaxID=3413046 RepID=UPI003BF08C2D
MKVWSYWFPYVLPNLRNCPIPLVEHELRNAAQQLLERSRAWQITLSTIPVLAGASSIVIPMDTDKELVRVENAYYDGAKLTVITSNSLDSDNNDDWSLHTGTPVSYLQLSPGVITLYPKPLSTASTGLKLRVSAKPSDAATGLPDEIAVKYRNEIAMGAKGKLMVYADKPWTNMDLGAAYLQSFNAMVDNSNINAARSNGQARIASRPKWS